MAIEKLFIGEAGPIGGTSTKGRGQPAAFFVEQFVAEFLELPLLKLHQPAFASKADWFEPASGQP